MASWFDNPPVRLASQYSLDLECLADPDGFALLYLEFPRAVVPGFYAFVDGSMVQPLFRYTPCKLIVRRLTLQRSNIFWCQGLCANRGILAAAEFLADACLAQIDFID